LKKQSGSGRGNPESTPSELLSQFRLRRQVAG
jgi:hypothetical protein